MNAKRGALILSMLIFGTIGVLRRHIGLSSGALAMLRGCIGAVCLAVFVLLGRKNMDFSAVRRNLAKLLLSGACIGLNWMLLFEAYNHTSVATATLCYYMAPVLVMLLSPAVLGEKLSKKQLVCAAAAIAGMIPVSGILSLDGFKPGEVKGVLLGLGAAALYACVILVNKRTHGVKSIDRAIVQLFAAAAVVTPYAFVAEGFSPAALGGRDMLLILVAGIVHTGLAYAMYFSAITALPARTAALMSYIDPISAVILSATILGEPMGPEGWIGALMVLGATIVSESEQQNA